MSRSVALIDANFDLLAQMTSELVGLGLRCEAIVDANLLLQRQEGAPDLIVLCIDPKRTGWAICNRLRKSPLLKAVPLLITSAEATAKDFEDHRKLKTRADDYLHKPFLPRDLSTRVCSMLGLPAPGASDELALDGDDLAVEDEVLVEEETNELAELDNESTRVGMRFEVEIDTSRVFDAREETDVIKVPNAPSTGLAAELGLDAVAKQAAEEPVRQRRPSSPFSMHAGTHDTTLLEAEVQSLRADRDRLLDELDRAGRTRTESSAGTSREKEFLSLREIINKKEKEVLDLREALDARLPR